MSLAEDIQKIAEEEGYNTSTQWISEVIIHRGWTFEQAAQYIASNYKRYYSWQHVYGVCRKMMTGPLLPARVRQYNPLARKLGYSTAIVMFREAVEKKKSCVDIAIDLDKNPCHIRNLISIADVRRVLKKRKRRKKKSKNGFLQPAAEKRWAQKAQRLGFKSVKAMINKWPGESKELAQVLGVTEQTVCLLKKR